MEKEENSNKGSLENKVNDEGVNTFLSTLHTQDQYYCIVNESVKDMHLALNPPKDFSRMNV